MQPKPRKNPSRWPFDGPCVLAPMEGVTHPTLRRLLVERGGLALVCTEFVRITRGPVSERQLKKHVQKAPGTPLSVQVMGNDPERMAEAAAIVSDAGADVVDVNLGCPMPRVVRKGVGAAMLKDLALLDRVLGMMRLATPGLLSAKIRAGYDDSKNVLDIARAVQDAGADFITVHPRRRADLYTGVADWRIIARIKEALDIPVVGNGDVWYAADALRMQQETGCDAVMIGRPVLRNPFIFLQIEQLRSGEPVIHPDGACVLNVLKETIRRYEADFAAEGRRTIGPIKEILRWLARALNDDAAFQREVLRQDTLEAILEVSHDHLAGLGARRLDLDAGGSLGLERSGSALVESSPLSIDEVA